MATDVKRTYGLFEMLSAAALILAVGTGVMAQGVPPTNSGVQGPPAATQGATTSSLVHLSLDRAIELALQHNHSLLAARATIDQSRAEEITANLRPNPLLSWDAPFLPFFNPSIFSSDYLNNSAQFDVGISYLIER